MIKSDFDQLINFEIESYLMTNGKIYINLLDNTIKRS